MLCIYHKDNECINEEKESSEPELCCHHCLIHICIDHDKLIDVGVIKENE